MDKRLNGREDSGGSSNGKLGLQKKIKKKALPLMPASSQNVVHLRLNIAKIWIQETFVQTLLFHL